VVRRLLDWHARPGTPVAAKPRAMDLTLCLLYLTGAVVVTLVSIVAMPARANVVAITAIVVGALTAAGISGLAAGTVPRWAYHAYNLVGTTSITAVIYLSHGGVFSIAVSVLYVLVALDSFFFFPWRAAAAQQAYGFASLLSLWVFARILPVAVVIALCAVIVATGMVVGWLVRAASQVEIDPLTRLLNRRGMDRILDEALAQSARTGDPFVVGYLDLDHFKSVNDTSGHAAGDHLLREAAVIWSGMLPSRAALGRYGGDEFVITLPGFDASAASSAIDALRAALPAGQTCSAGFAEWEPADTASLLLRRADTALFQAKRAGRDRTYPQPDGGVSVRELREAIAKDQLYVVFQPIADLTSGSVVGAEALVRWRHPVRGIVPPDEFIPLAEKHGMIHAIDRWVLETACRQVAEADRAGAYLERISVNVTSQELDRPDYLLQVRDILRDSGLPAHRLTLEITESSVVADAGTLMANLAALRADGVRVAIDDFGTGYSSLSRLEHFPVDTVKIDRAFVRRITDASHPTPIVTTIIALADTLSLSVVAEGIEEEHQAVALAAHGCRVGQGWLFGRPGPFADLVLPVVPRPPAGEPLLTARMR
jgi:diguanylate cyclase (GGDEF)-like protein